MTSNEYEVEYITETPAGLCVSDGDRRIWLPKSQIEDFLENSFSEGDMITITVPDWLAEDKELC